MHHTFPQTNHLHTPTQFYHLPNPTQALGKPIPLFRKFPCTLQFCKNFTRVLSSGNRISFYNIVDRGTRHRTNSFTDVPVQEIYTPNRPRIFNANIMMHRNDQFIRCRQKSLPPTSRGIEKSPKNSPIRIPLPDVIRCGFGYL